MPLQWTNATSDERDVRVCMCAREEIREVEYEGDDEWDQKQ